MTPRERFAYITLCAGAVVLVLGLWALAIDGVIELAAK